MNNNLTHCAKCGAEFKPYGIGTGYATRDNQRICYACTDAEQREDMRDRSQPFVAYVSSDGRTVTTWTGGKLGDARYIGTVRLTRRSYTHGATMNSYRVTDVHGGEWYGRGSPGIAITLRPCKGSR